MKNPVNDTDLPSSVCDTVAPLCSEEEEQERLGGILMFKVQSGETVIARVIHEGHDELLGEFLTLHKPITTAIMPTPNGPAMQAMPWMPGEVKLSMMSVIAYTEEVPQKLSDAYLQMSSGVEISSEMPAVVPAR